MKAEEERRQLEGRLQAEALRQQMEELKQKEMEVRGTDLATPLLLVHGNGAFKRPFREDHSRDQGSVNQIQPVYPLLMCAPHSCFHWDA